MEISSQTPWTRLSIEKPKSTWGEYRNTAVIRIETVNFERILYWTIDSTKKRRRWFIRVMWAISNWLYERYRPMRFYKCIIEIRLNSDELKKLCGFEKETYLGEPK